MVVLVSGGGWGVGNIRPIVSRLVGETDLFVLVACGDNERLRQELERCHGSERLRALPYWHDMPGLLAASDALVQTGVGMTCLEAMAVGLPIVLFNVLPGHGARSAAALAADGAARWPRTGCQLVESVRDAVTNSTRRRVARERAESLRRLPSVAASMATRVDKPPSVVPSGRTKLRMRTALGAALMLLLVSHVSMLPAYSDLSRATEMVRQGVLRTGTTGHVNTCQASADSDDGRLAWHARPC
jgi:hypothetical protein